MAAVSESTSRVLEPHIPSGERLIEAHTADGRTVAVTDRRVIELHHEEDDMSQDTSLESVLLTSDYVVGSEYGRTEDTTNPLVEWIAGGLLAFLGVVIAVVGSETSALVIGVGLILGGVAVVYLSRAQTSGEISATVHRTGDLSDRSRTFPQGEAEVARAISEQVATLNGPA
ncbi:hypothetical protein EGH21_21320 [Halomicroarcula sp. F13]|uniref:Uncharacterized protein n=1 Tax=Haloarcula rubra TaxID=2487747 RepID=A0AAW4PV60_9EURY|nr:hypothetical protein [Halomicroarcula rubra]MBX0325568.1 hypothetical protein [Halomicroarcula rubra]